MTVAGQDLQADVIIAGGGIAGSTLALLLAGRNLECIVLEERSGDAVLERNDPRTLAITIASANILRAAEAWQRIPENRTGYFRRMFVWEEEGKGDIAFDSADLCEATLGYIIEQNVLEWALQEACRKPGRITRYQSATIRKLDVMADRVSVRLTNGRELCARLVIGADGARSTLRTMAGISYPVHDYHQQAVACVVQTELPHESVARQRFLATGPLAFLPMADSHHCGVVWSTAPAHAGELLAMDDSDFNNTLGEAFSYALGQIVSSQSRSGFPLQRAQADHYCLPRIALIGDAAHTVHPLAGQGANLGLLDAAALAEVILTAADRHLDIGAYPVLRRYERWRRGENFLMLKVIEGLKYLFESRLASVKHLRSLGLDMTDMASPVKQVIMRYAMGLSGDLPVFARPQQSV